MAQDKYEYMSKCPHFFSKKKIIIKTPPYIYYLIFVMFNRGAVHIVVAVILLTITLSCLTEERFILLWLVILLTITV